MSSAIILLYLYRDRLSYICLPPLQLEAEIAAVIAATEGFRPMPDKVGMQVAVSNIVAVAETVAQLRAMILCAEIIVGAFYHIDAPDAVRSLDLFSGKARCLTEHLGRLLGEDRRDAPIESGNPHQFEKDLLQLPGAFFHIVVDGLQGFLFGKDGLQRFIRGDSRQDLIFQMPLFLLGRTSIFPAQLCEPMHKRLIQCAYLFGKTLCDVLLKGSRKITCFHL